MEVAKAEVEVAKAKLDGAPAEHRAQFRKEKADADVRVAEAEVEVAKAEVEVAKTKFKGAADEQRAQLRTKMDEAEEDLAKARDNLVKVSGQRTNTVNTSFFSNVLAHNSRLNLNGLELAGFALL